MENPCHKEEPSNIAPPATEVITEGEELQNYLQERKSNDKDYLEEKTSLYIIQENDPKEEIILKKVQPGSGITREDHLTPILNIPEYKIELEK